MISPPPLNKRRIFVGNRIRMDRHVIELGFVIFFAFFFCFLFIFDRLRERRGRKTITIYNAPLPANGNNRAHRVLRARRTILYAHGR